jgi:hypothetical protein
MARHIADLTRGLERLLNQLQSNAAQAQKSSEHAQMYVGHTPTTACT